MEQDQDEIPTDDIVDLAGAVRELSTENWPSGYVYGATRYADVILRESFSDRARDLEAALTNFAPTLDELRSGGGGRTVFVKRFDDSLGAMTSEDGQQIWGKQNITISSSLLWTARLCALLGREATRSTCSARGHWTRRSLVLRSRWSGTTRIPSTTAI